MYSMVLTLAMSTALESAACCHHASYCCAAYSWGCGGCYGCYGGCYGCYGGCYGCYGFYAYYPPVSYSPALYAATPVGQTAPVVATAPAKPKSGPAYLTINVPADAKVIIGGVATNSSSTVRRFTTPEIPYGAAYYYKVDVEVVRDGKTYTATEKVTIEAGANSNLTLNPIPAPALASK